MATCRDSDSDSGSQTRTRTPKPGVQVRTADGPGRANELIIHCVYEHRVATSRQTPANCHMAY